MREVARRAVEDLLSLLRDPGQEPGDVGDGRSRNSLSLRNSFGKTTPSCSRPAWSMTRRLLWERSSAGRSRGDGGCRQRVAQIDKQRVVEERVGVAVGHGLVVEPLFQQLRVEKDLRPVGRGGRALECERDRAAVRLERAREDLARSGATTLPLLPIPGGARALRSVRGGAGEPKRR